ncbi:MAG: hypothetical protein PGN24_00755 [Microbacterium arborescens]
MTGIAPMRSTAINMHGMRDARTPSDSRCSQPENAPYRWLDAVKADHPSVLRFDERFALMIGSLRAMIQGEIEDLFEAAARGELEESADDYAPLKPIVTDPEIWELRFGGPGEYRFYHGEPPRHPHVLVKLHRHVKDDAARQQDEILQAVQQYRP